MHREKVQIVVIELYHLDRLLLMMRPSFLLDLAFAFSPEGILLVNIATSLLAFQKFGLELQVLPVVPGQNSRPKCGSPAVG